MKDQYFGDVNDFRKYGLLRSLTVSNDLRLGVCWMLTKPDRRRDGSLLSYLDNGRRYRPYDPVLFDWLKLVVGAEKDRRTARLEVSGLLGRASFQSKILGDTRSERDQYFSECIIRFTGCDLVFFDPDNGLETRSTRPGRKGSSKYLYWDEVGTTFKAGSSLLIYQHFIREERTRFLRRLTSELRHRTQAATVFSFTTPHTLLLLASQDRHAAAFRRQLAVINAGWGPSQIVAAEHSTSTAEQLQRSHALTQRETGQ